MNLVRQYRYFFSNKVKNIKVGLCTPTCTDTLFVIAHLSVFSNFALSPNQLWVITMISLICEEKHPLGRICYLDLFSVDINDYELSMIGLNV